MYQTLLRPLCILSHLLLFSYWVVSDSLWPHGLQHTRLPCPSLSPGVCSNSCPLSRWCHPTISFSVIPFSSCSQSALAQNGAAKLLSHFSGVQLCATPQTAAHQAPLSLGFSRQEHLSGLPFPSPMHESEKWKWSCSVVSDS